MALLDKWLFKLLTKNGTLQTLLRRKYVGSIPMSQLHWKPRDSHFWADIMATKKFFFPYWAFGIRDWPAIRFWEDKWLGNATLSE
jgi:hypothetical protein